MPRTKTVQPPPADARQLELFPQLTRYAKPITVTVRGRWGVERVPIAELPDWLARHAERTKSGA